MNNNPPGQGQNGAQPISAQVQQLLQGLIRPANITATNFPFLSEQEIARFTDGVKRLWQSVTPNNIESDPSRQGIQKLQTITGHLRDRLRQHKEQAAQQAVASSDGQGQNGQNASQQPQSQLQQSGGNMSRPGSATQGQPVVAIHQAGASNQPQARAQQQSNPQEIPQLYRARAETIPWVRPVNIPPENEAAWKAEVIKRHAEWSYKHDWAAKTVQRLDAMIKQIQDTGKEQSQIEALMKQHKDAFAQMQAMKQQLEKLNNQRSKEDTGSASSNPNMPLAAGAAARMNQQQQAAQQGRPATSGPGGVQTQSAQSPVGPSPVGQAFPGGASRPQTQGGVPQQPSAAFAQNQQQASAQQSQPQSAVVPAPNSAATLPQTSAGPEKPVSFSHSDAVAAAAAARTASAQQQQQQQQQQQAAGQQQRLAQPSNLSQQTTPVNTTATTTVSMQAQGQRTDAEKVNKHSLPINKAFIPQTPLPVSMAPARPTFTGPSNGPLGSMGQPAIQKQPSYVLQGAGQHVLDKKKLDELVRQVMGGDGSDGQGLQPEVEESVLQLADEFIDNVVSAACRLAKLRGASTLEIRDIQLILERQYNIRIPGYATDEVRTVRKVQPASGYLQKMNAVQAAKVIMGAKTDP